MVTATFPRKALGGGGSPPGLENTVGVRPAAQVVPRCPTPAGDPPRTG
jgi:hypothetical protein